MKLRYSILIVTFLCTSLSSPSYGYDNSKPRSKSVSQELDRVETKIAQLKNKVLEAKRANYNKAKEECRNIVSRPYAGKENISGKKGRLYVSMGGNWYYIHYREVNGNGSTLDEETGGVWGFYTKLGYVSSTYNDIIKGRPFVEGYFRYNNGKVKYDGATSGGDPFYYKANLDIYRYGVKLGGKRRVSKDREIFGYVDFGKRVWYRGENGIINGVIVYKEKYSWFYFGFGGGINWLLSKRWVVGFEGEIMYAPEDFREMHSELYDGTTFTLGTVWGLELSFPIKYALSRRIALSFTPYYTYWRINESDTRLVTSGGFPAGYFVEPDSHTYMYGLLFGLTVSFM